MKQLIITIGIIAVITACQSQGTKPAIVNHSNIHEVVVEKILQTTSYTYLFVKEGESKQWLAIPKMNAQIGDTYYHSGGMKMTNFESKELGRTFNEVYFLEGVSKNSTGTKKSLGDVASHNKKRETKNIEKSSNIIEPAENGITIAALYAGKTSYNGKTVKIRGQVNKFNAAIMGKNWIHIQDGSEHEGNYDLTITTASEFKIGDIATFEGKVSLDKDYGFGYQYDIIIEDAVVVE